MGFDNWNNIPPDVERFLIEAGTMMVEELDKSDASQVVYTFVVLINVTIIYIYTCQKHA